jgi:hypothetical protein
VLLQNVSCNDVGCNQLWTMCGIISCVKYCGDHAHQILSCLHIRTESYENFCAPRASVKTARQKLGDRFFRV